MIKDIGIHAIGRCNSDQHNLLEFAGTWYVSNSVDIANKMHF